MAMGNVRMQPAEREFSFSDEQFRFLSQLANQRTGIVLAEHKRDMVYGRLVRRLRALKLGSFAEYCDLLQSSQGDDELGQMINAITTNLTSFFREAHHFEHLKKDVLLPIAKKKQRFRIWSAGCSAGMEPYSIAMTMKDAIPDVAGWDARVLATDIDSNMLATASAGEYKDSEWEDIPADYKKYAERSKHKGTIQMTPEIQSLIAFKQLNLLEAWPMKGKFDVIFCRNVVIYFDKPTKQKLFERYADMLAPGGWLYIGHSENLHNISDRFKLIGRTIYRKVK